MCLPDFWRSDKAAKAEDDFFAVMWLEHNVQIHQDAFLFFWVACSAHLLDGYDGGSLAVTHLYHCATSTCHEYTWWSSTNWPMHLLFTSVLGAQNNLIALYRQTHFTLHVVKEKLWDLPWPRSPRCSRSSTVAGTFSLLPIVNWFVWLKISLCRRSHSRSLLKNVVQVQCM